MLYNIQFHLVTPSTGIVVIIRANSFVPVGVPDQDNAGLHPVLSHVYSGGIVPPSGPASLESEKVLLSGTIGVTVGITVGLIVGVTVGVTIGTVCCFIIHADISVALYVPTPKRNSEGIFCGILIVWE